MANPPPPPPFGSDPASLDWASWYNELYRYINAAVEEATTFTDVNHDHTGGDGAQIDHTTLSNIGTNTHAQIDTHISNAVTLSDVYPVGSIYLSTSSTNPNTTFGFGTWTQTSRGRVLVGEGTSDTAYSGGATGGASTHTLQTSEIPSHTHTQYGSSISGDLSPGPGSAIESFSSGGADTTTGATGGGGSHNNMPPYLVVYVWERTA